MAPPRLPASRRTEVSDRASPAGAADTRSAQAPRPRGSHPIDRARRGWLWLALMLSVALFASHVQGQTSDGPREINVGDRETARSLMDDGDAKLAVGDYRGALDAYLAADKIMGVPTTGVDVGRAQHKLGLLLEARDTWLRVTRYPARPDEPDAFTKARRQARALATAIAGRIPSLQIEVTGVAPDVAIK